MKIELEIINRYKDCIKNYEKAINSYKTAISVYKNTVFTLIFSNIVLSIITILLLCN